MIVAAILAFTLAAGNSPPILVQGDSLCPSASDIGAILPELLPPAEASYPDIAWVEAVGRDLRIELRSVAGEVLSSRQLTSNGSCADLANIAAVVIASWMAERNTSISLLQLGVPAPSKPAALPPSPTLTGARAPVVIAQRRIREFDLSLAVGGSANSAGFVGVTRAELGVRGQRFGLRAGFSAETERSEIIESRNTGWRRYGLSLGPTFAAVRRPVMVEARAEFFAGITTVAGQGFDTDRKASAIAPGLALVLRVGSSTGRIRPWVEVGGQYWLARQGITVTRPGQSDLRSVLPSLEGRLLAGISLNYPRSGIW
jgi:hypothetical protein